jgi:hypothetical protein
MAIIRYRPPAPLNSYIGWLWWSQRDLPQFHCEHMLPSASTQLIFALHDGPYTWRRRSSEETSTVWTRGVVHGPQWSYFVSGPKPCGSVAGVSFRAGAAGAVLGVPITELTDRHISIDALWGERGRSMHQRLLDAHEPMAVLRAIEQELMSRFTRPLLIHPAIAHALADGAQGWGITRISSVQRQAGALHIPVPWRGWANPKALLPHKALHSGPANYCGRCQFKPCRTCRIVRLRRPIAPDPRISRLRRDYTDPVSTTRS